jgi:hypothetical protein
MFVNFFFGPLNVSEFFEITLLALENSKKKEKKYLENLENLEVGHSNE